jgi:hypothetical protein
MNRLHENGNARETQLLEVGDLKSFWSFVKWAISKDTRVGLNHHGEA